MLSYNTDYYISLSSNDFYCRHTCFAICILHDVCYRHILLLYMTFIHIPFCVCLLPLFHFKTLIACFGTYVIIYVTHHIRHALYNYNENQTEQLADTMKVTCAADIFGFKQTILVRVIKASDVVTC